MLLTTILEKELAASQKENKLDHFWLNWKFVFVKLLVKASVDPLN